MKDVAALCKRVVVVANGRIEYDGSLLGIVDKFSGSKIITLQLAEGHEPNLHGVGEVLAETWPKVRLQVPRAQVAEVLSRCLAEHPIEDVVVEDPPLEDVIAELFRETSSKQVASS
jgi:ABC-2 type transport system ATP-binding protein